ncbi:hypothetical protein [Baekduia sp. Peel2402]|uniref:hypothetical protein n=1 Tax=Baekduia sp. Peel2402 TaxID=3458296 RepID=UPI00403EF336
MPPFTHSCRAALAALGTLLALSLALPTPSKATGTYIHRSCITGTDISDGPLGWQPFSYAIPGSQTMMRCADDGSLYAEMLTYGSVPAGKDAGWTYHAPTGTTISRITGSIAGWTSPWSGSQGLIQVLDETSVKLELTGLIQQQYPSTLDLDHLGASKVTFRAICDPIGTACPNNVAWAALYQPELYLADDAPPVVGFRSGSFVTDQTLVGDERLNFSATDAGGGVARLRLYVDGQPTSVDHVIDENEGRCVPSDTLAGVWVFSVPRPCPVSVSGNEVIDTTRIADGSHTLTVKVADTAQQETTVWSGTYLVANRPPFNARLPLFADNSVVTNALVGSAIEAVNDGTWTGPNLTVTRNWARCQADGSDPCVTIPGATGLTYTPSTADVGHRLRLLVTALNVAGAVTVASRPTGIVTSRNGGGGSTSDPTPDPDPDPTADPDPDPTPGGGGGGAPSGSSATNNTTLPPAPLPVAPFPVATAHALVGHVVGEASGVGCPQDKATLKFQHGAVKLGYGRTSTAQLQLMCTNNGKAIERARLDVVTRVGSRPAVASSVTTDGAGRALVRLAAGPGRAIVVGYRMYADDPVARATAALKVSVNGRISLRGDHRKLRNGKALRLRGRLLGGYVPRRGVTLTVQWKDHNRWRPFAQIKTTKKGSFSYAYRFTRTNRPITYTLRVQATKGQLDYPFLPVASNPVKVTVMP